MKKNTLLLSLIIGPLCYAGSDIEIIYDFWENSFPTITTTFADGDEGWFGPNGLGGVSGIEETGGNPDEHLMTDFDIFGINFRNTRNPDFVFDYTLYPEILISIYVKVYSINSSNIEEPRPWLVEIRDYNEPGSEFPWTSVWYLWGDISQETTNDWTRFTVLIEDTSVTELPPGWGGYGAEDEFGNPSLPRGRTFADVLANMDEISFNTLMPGNSYTDSRFQVRVDNISIGTDLIFDDSFESIPRRNDGVRWVKY
ncbi:MAG: hypothetical protein R3E90_05970 [Marinicella sp.]